MAENKNILLRHFAENGDTEAFTKLVKQYAGLVYGTCLRILGDQNQAADATQETFFQLLRNASQITGSVSSWLHKVAAGKSVDLIRKDSRRRDREAKYAGTKKIEVEKWEDISFYIDDALNELDAQSREILIQHFFENKTMDVIAAETGVSQPTISRKIESAVSRLGDKLYKKGIIVTSAILTSLLFENAAQAAPAVVLNELGKMAIVTGLTQAAAGTGAVVSAANTTAAAALGIKAKIIIATTIAAVGIGSSVITYNTITRQGQAVETSQVAKFKQNTLQGYGSQNQLPEQTSLQSAEPIESGDSEPAEATAENTNSEFGSYGGGYAVGGMGGYGGGMMGGMSYGGTSGESQVAVDLTSPDKTIESFAKILASGDFNRLAECFVPAATDYSDLMTILHQDRPELAQAKQAFTSIGEPVEITDITADDTGTHVKWLFTVKKPFTIEGRPFKAGDKFEMDATVVETNGKWLIKEI
jgi:RNA polymerase sigma factor (sigma-70 family)